MSHDRGCPCGREKYEYDDCDQPGCWNREDKPMGHYDHCREAEAERELAKRKALDHAAKEPSDYIKTENDRILDAAFEKVRQMGGVIMEPFPPTPVKKEAPRIEGTMKSWPAFFQAILSGFKRHDIRSKKDRNFAVGQHWRLAEYDPFAGVFTGRELIVEITYITSNETPCAYSSAVLDRDACVLSFRVVE